MYVRARRRDRMGALLAWRLRATTARTHLFQGKTNQTGKLLYGPAKSRNESKARRKRKRERERESEKKEDKNNQQKNPAKRSISPSIRTLQSSSLHWNSWKLKNWRSNWGRGSRRSGSQVVEEGTERRVLDSSGQPVCLKWYRKEEEDWEKWWLKALSEIAGE